MKKSKEFFIQILIAGLVSILLGILVNNLIVNLINTQLGFSFNWLYRPASFALAEYSLPFSPSDSYAWALFIGWLNSLKVIFFSLILATLLGIFIGVLSTKNNLAMKYFSSLYITLIRQTPLLLQLMLWYFVVFLGLRSPWRSPILDILIISNQGIKFLGAEFSTEFSALFLGLSVFTGAYIAEVVRGGINSVDKGQWEAFRSLGLSEGLGLYRIIIPQALPAILPGLTSQYLNLAKNSTLAIAIGYADVYAISDTVINQTGKAIEGFLILLISFLLLNLIITYGMEILNKLVLKNYNSLG